MVYTILVPLDGSATAEQALPYAERFARGVSGNLLLLQDAPPFVFTGTEVTVERPAATVDAQSYLDQLARLLDTWQLTVETCVTQTGDAARAIVDEVRAKNVDLVVMTTHGRSAPGRWLFGSVADDVLRHSRAPVVLVPPDAAPVWPETRSARIIVPLDGSAFAESVLPSVSMLAEAIHAELLLLRVVQWPPVVAASEIAVEPYPPLDEQLDEVDRYLTATAEEANAAVPVVRIRAKLGQPGFAIADAAQDEHADLIAMATHGRSGVMRMLLGSVATSTLRHARVPVFFVRPDAA